MPILFLALIVVALDQWAKFSVQSQMTPGMSIPVINDIFHITYVLNPGAAFGILEHQTGFFLLVALTLFIAILYFYPRIPPGYRLLRIGLGLQVGGAMGNVVDRVKTGFVVDFLDFRVWPVFNIADMAIVVGVSLIIFDVVYLSGKRDEKK
ncbi:MAG: signal peptidase II [Negativicutes bacterium]|nr:signal peptidase II [Negativicutes bacterium]